MDNGYIMGSYYEPLTLKQEIVIEKIVTIHYFEYTSDFFFPGELHDFWEFLFVDKGEIDVVADTKSFTLKKGELIFHKPMEFHSLKANGVIAPNLVVMAFACNSPAMKFFEDKILRVGDDERNIMADIISEARNAFISPLDDPNLKKLERNESNPLLGSEQIIKISLEKMLIQMLRKGEKKENYKKITSSIKEKAEQEIFNKIILYLEDHISEQISVKELCRIFNISYSYLQKLFKKKTGGGVVEYFGRIKIEKAKEYIREKTYNFTEIAQMLGYSSIHYFSRCFKAVTGMTPTEYATSVKIRSENLREFWI